MRTGVVFGMFLSLFGFVWMGAAALNACDFAVLTYVRECLAQSIMGMLLYASGVLVLMASAFGVTYTKKG